MTTLKPGDVLASKYRLEEVIGRGGFATVYRALDLTIDRAVAVKLLEADHRHGAARFIREAKILGELQDAHTVRLFDFGRADDGTLFMVVELLGGQDLSELLAQRGKLTAPEAEHILRQVLSSLREAHAEGLLHRDIKPANIRVHTYAGDPLRVTLMDFGVARQEIPGAAKLTATGARVGTAAYMAPEQAVGANIAPATDLFSLGLVIAQCLTGDLQAVRNSLMRNSSFDFGARPQLMRALSAMLELDIADRVRSADAVIGILDGPDEPASPPPGSYDASRSQSGPQPVRHSSGRVVAGEAPDRGWLGVGGAVASLLVIAAVFAWGLRDDAQTAEVQPRVRNIAALTGANAPPEPAAAPDASSARSENAEERDRGCGQMPERAGFERRRSTADLSVVEWHRYLPKNYEPAKKHPVLLAFHTDDGSAKKLVDKGRLRELADELGLIVIAPRGPSPFAWAGMFPETVRTLLETNREEVCIDTEHVFVLGYGAGGFPAEALSCEPWVHATIFVSHRSALDHLPCPDTPKPIAFFQPMKSKHFPLVGGANCSKTRHHVSLAEQEEYLRTRNACAGEREQVSNYKTSPCFSWACETPLLVCHVDGGHQFPNTGKRDFDVFRCDGPDPDFPYLDRFLSFLEPLL